MSIETPRVATAVPPLRFALVAGEASGDLLGAGLIRELRARMPHAAFAGIGGSRMQAEGLDAWWPCEDLAVMGLGEVVRHLPRLLRLRAALRRRLIDWQPDVFIGIDAPDFNLRLERVLKQRGITTVHYVSPSVWAWRTNRAARIGRSADRVLCLFPMEPPIYAAHGVDARFVGHPLADRSPMVSDRAAARRALVVADDARVLALLPGSRAGEIARLAPVFLDAVALLLDSEPRLHVLAPMANARCRAQFESELAQASTRHPLLAGCVDAGAFRTIDGSTPDVLAAADAALLASGTAALEAMLAKRPTVIAYIVAPLTAWLVRRFKLIHSRFTALPNVLAGEELMPELLQENCTAPRLAAALGEQFGWNGDRRRAFEERCAALHATLRCDADNEAADAVLDLLEDAA